MILRFDATTYDLADSLEVAGQLPAYITELQAKATASSYDTVEASINLPSDNELREQVKALVQEKVTEELQYIFVIGIGGSNLGTKAIYDALYGYQDQQVSNRPRIIFVDTTNLTQLRFCIDSLFPSVTNPNQLLIVSISKSGGTTETIANSELLIAAATERFGTMTDRVVVITDEGSAFANAADVEGIAHLSIPKQVGGRYSVLSAVGLFPLAALGLDIEALHAGARDIRSYCLNEDMNHNPAAQSAAVIADQYGQGKIIHDMFVFHSELESLGKWYRQLMGESIGKEYNLAGEQVFTGITPTVSVGSTDLHSVGQLYLGGPKDKLTTFLNSKATHDDLTVPKKRIFPSVVSMIDGQTTAQIMEAILGGVKLAYNKRDVPFMSVELDNITPYEIGAFMQFKMIEMMYLGKLLNVNPFDQPNVESYKSETKRILEQ